MSYQGEQSSKGKGAPGTRNAVQIIALTALAMFSQQVSQYPNIIGLSPSIEKQSRKQAYLLTLSRSYPLLSRTRSRYRAQSLKPSPALLFLDIHLDYRILAFSQMNKVTGSAGVGVGNFAENSCKERACIRTKMRM